MYKKLVLATLISGLCFQATANDESASETQFGFSAGLMTGGDDLGGLDYENGDSVNVAAGGLFSIGASVRTIFNESFVSKFNAKYEFDSASASNAEATFSRIAVDALAGYPFNENFTLYGGLTYHLSPEYSEEDDYSDNRMSFDDSLGFIIELAYNMSENSEISLRYVKAEYDLASFKIGSESFDVGNTPLPKTDASSIGIFWTGYF